MKKIGLLFLVLFVFALCVACAKETKHPLGGTEQSIDEDVYEVLIPASYLKYSGLEAKELKESLGVKATVEENGVLIRATQMQIDNLIQKNNKNAEKYIKSFEEYNEKYRFVGSKDYSTIEFYCDEMLDNQQLFIKVAAISTTYAMNNILYNKNSDWDVIIKVINCHTGKEVIEGSILKDKMTINNETWEKTYADKE